MVGSIPDFTDSGILPAGIHWASWQEIHQRFGQTARRQDLLIGLMEGINALRMAGCRAIFLDGSFCTNKLVPGDFDVCYEDGAIDWDMLQQIAPVLLQFDNQRAAQKAKYLGEFFPYSAVAAPPNTLFLEFFQIDKVSGLAKGIVGLKL